MSRRRRKYSRVCAQSLVAHLHLDGKLVGGGAVENISAGGLLVRTGQQLPSGAVVQLDLVRPGMKKPFRLPGWVVGASGAPPALRIQFDLGADSAAARLHGLLNELGLREVVEPAGGVPALDVPASLPPAAPDAPLAEIELSPAEIDLSPADMGPPPPAALVPRRPPAAAPPAAARPPSPPAAPAAARALVPWEEVPPGADAHSVSEEPSLQQQLRSLQEELRQARQQLERHERELGLLRADLRARRPSA